MFISALVIAIIAGLLSGGRISGLSRLDIKYTWMIFTAFLIQLGIDYLAPRYPFGGYFYFHLISYLLLCFSLINNRHLSGMNFILAGTVLNFAVIAFNGGQMPVRADVLPQEMVQALATGMGGTHGLLSETTRLGFLGDIIYLSLPYQSQLISIGDVMIDIGLLVLVIRGMRNSRQAEV